MRQEISVAVVFLTRVLRINGSISEEKVDEFSLALSAILTEKFKNHWYTDKPAKGQGYRCIRVNPSEPIDSVLNEAAISCGLRYKDLNLPPELTLWVDPAEVCYRLDEARGTFCLLASFKDGNTENRMLSLDVKEIIEEAIQKHNEQLNIKTTRTNRSNQPTCRDYDQEIFWYDPAFYWQQEVYSDQTHLSQHQSNRNNHANRQPSHHQSNRKNNKFGRNGYNSNANHTMNGTSTHNHSSNNGEKFRWVRNRNTDKQTSKA